MRVFGYVLFSLLIGSSFTHHFAQAETTTSAAAESLSNQWAQATFMQPTQKQRSLYESLSTRSAALAKNHSNDADLLTWVGIVHSSYAGSINGLGALKVVKKAKRYFERAMAIDPEALSGGARTSLGSLYQHVPGWPIGFGNKKTAEKYLKLSAQTHPNNIDALYFYAQFLQSQSRTKEAKFIYEQALSLKSHLYSDIIFQGRVTQIQRSLESLDAISALNTKP